MAERRAGPAKRSKTTNRTGAARRGRLRSLPWAKIGLASALVLVLVAVVPPLRQAAALGASRAILFVASPLAPDLGDFDSLASTTRILAADGSVITELDESERRKPVALSQLPPHVPKAVLAAEDENFYEHSGVDPGGVFRAFLRNAQGGGGTQGGSTITQQLAKLNYTARERTFARKLKEVLYASELEKQYSKDELLERYLNQVYFGDGAYGIAAAAEAFFGKPAQQLTVSEAALLAGKIRSPERVDPREDPDGARRRRDQVLANMREEGYIDQAALGDAKGQPIRVVPPQPVENANAAPHFVEFVKREVQRLDALGGSPEARAKQLFTGGYTVQTTLDRKAFDAAVRSVQATLGRPDDPTTAIASVQPGDGAVRVLFGGLDFSKTQFDVASLGRRQPGSAFKPFVYLAALREGIDPRSTFDGRSPRKIPCYNKEVRNYAGEDAGGAITVDEALVKSVNTVFVELGCKAGVRAVFDAARDDGIPEEATKAQGGIFLGALDQGVTALELAAAYATFTAKGTYAEPYAVTAIKDRKGRTVYEHDRKTRRVFDEAEVGVLNVPMQGVVQRGTGTAAAIDRPVAGKTGTTQDNVDAWFAGYTPQLSTAVWVGYPERAKPMKSVRGRAVTGGSFPAQIFSRMMRDALRGVRAAPIPTAKPDELDLKRAAPARSDESPSTTGPSTTVPPESTTTSSSTSSTTTSSTTAPSTTTTTQPRRTTTTTSTTQPQSSSAEEGSE